MQVGAHTHTHRVRHTYIHTPVLLYYSLHHSMTCTTSTLGICQQILYEISPYLQIYIHLKNQKVCHKKSYLHTLEVTSMAPVGPKYTINRITNDAPWDQSIRVWTQVQSSETPNTQENIVTVRLLQSK